MEKVKVFVSWSGVLSQKVARLLGDWMPTVIQSIDPFISEDTQKGLPWFTTILKQLEESDFGIICVTSENHQSSWLNFEAGALVKKFQESYCCPVLFNMNAGDLKPPLSQLQLTQLNREMDMRRLFERINEKARLKEAIWKKAFESAWVNFANSLDEILKTNPEKTIIARSPEERLDEMNRNIVALTTYIMEKDQRSLITPSGQFDSRTSLASVSGITASSASLRE